MNDSAARRPRSDATRAAGEARSDDPRNFGGFAAFEYQRTGVFSRRAAAEFPNDNPELHDGLVWVLPAPVGRALPTLRLRPLAGALPRVLGPAWEAPGEELPPDGRSPETARVAPAPGLAEVVAPPNEVIDAAAATDEVLAVVAPPDEVVAVAAAPDEVLGVAAASDEVAGEPELPAADSPFVKFVATVVAVAVGRGATRAAAALAALLEHGRVAPGAFEATTLKTLISRRILASSGTHATPEFRATTEAWRAVLDGLSADLTPCGSATLDAWSAELVAAALDAPSSAVPELRRALRRGGIAAFGLLAVA